MSLALPKSVEKALVGNDAAWLLSFYAKEDGGLADKPFLELGRDEYYADIRASLPGGLEGGVYSFVIEGLTDDHYQQIADEKMQFVKLALFWRDTNASPLGYALNVAGLTDAFGAVKQRDVPDTARVATLARVSVTRKAGSRRYETTIVARERIFESLSRRLCGSVEKDTLEDTVKELLENQAGLETITDYKWHDLTPCQECPPQQAAHEGNDRRALERGRTYVDVLRELGARMEEQTGRHGRGMFLIRNGTLHIGVRDTPLDGDVKELTLATGLIESLVIGRVETDPNFDHCAHPQDKPPAREQYRLTLKGRPDIKPGDVVTFVPSPEDAAKTQGGAFGAIGSLFQRADLEKAVRLYVESVEHVLGRTTSFVTSVTGVVVEEGKEWDCHSPRNRGTAETPRTAASPEHEAANAVHRLARSVVDARRFTEVGEIRAMTVETSDDQPSQTLTVWRGLEPGDGRGNQARRLAVARPSPAPASDVPYATPFAWGKCGLVLPRYPGTRVVVSHRNGLADDPIEIGALWESAHGPDSKAGDWWLILPVGVDESKRATIEDDATPEEHGGKATNDLIDADGNRVITLGELTVRVGRSKALKNAGERPTRGEEDAITIEHADGEAKIVIKKDGSVSITAKNVAVEASEEIKLKAANVKVEVSGSMDVR